MLHRLWIPAGPWAVQVMEVDRNACWMPVAAKGGETAAGRRTTTEIIGKMAPMRGNPGVAGGVNGDFFLFNPAGIPVGAHIERGIVYTGATRNRPSFVVDDTGGISIFDLETSGEVAIGGRPPRVPISTWNHLAPRGQLALLDERYSAGLDTASRRLLIRARVISAANDTISAVVFARDTAATRRAGPEQGTIVLTGIARDSLAVLSMFASRVAVGDTLIVHRQISAYAPIRDAVSGFPRLLRNGVLAPRIDSAGNEGFRGRHPRTAVGYDRAKRRLLLVTVDGRQEGWSAGMSLRELADLLLRLGASDALNLDGGGSTAMVVRSAHGLVLANRPSDKGGERPVANALVIVRRPGCDN